MALTKIKTINSYAGVDRWMAELGEKPVAWLARVQVEEIPSPYAYSPTVAVWGWKGRNVVLFEVRHRTYHVFEVSPQLLQFKTEEAAEDWHIRFMRSPVAA